MFQPSDTGGWFDDEGEMVSKVLPLMLFLICIAIAIILVLTFRAWWPAALAIAISGAAMALATRPQQIGVSHSSEVAQDLEHLRAELDEARATITDLADVSEQLAAMIENRTPQSPGHGIEAEEFASLSDRLANLENTVNGLINDQQITSETRTPRAAKVSTPVSTEPQPASRDQDRSDRTLQSLMARATGRTAAEPAADQPLVTKTVLSPVELAPVFEPALGSPVAFILSPSDSGDNDTVMGLFRQAKRIADELEEANRPVRLFVRLSAQRLADQALQHNLLKSIDNDDALRSRLTLMTPQDGFNETAQATLSTLAERGCNFALEAVRDWSLNLAALSRQGLDYIMVDGPAMAQSAKQQGGDPRRLAEALALQDIALIAGDVEHSGEIELARSLNPALMTGNGLGRSRVMEALS